MVEPLFDDFFSLTTTIRPSSYSSYRTYLTTNVIGGIAASSVIEENYIDIVAFSIDSGHKSLALNLVDNIRKKTICNSKALSALNSYYKFIANHSSQKMATASLHKCCVYGLKSSSLRNTKIKNSLRNQSRISGNKTWLPLIFIANLYRHYGSNDFNQWIDNIYKKIHVILKGLTTPTSKNHILLKDIDYLGICRTGVVVALYKNSWYQVMTPSGFLNEKENMEVFGDFSKISIDHVTPIDLTLKTLKLPTLEVISNFMKAYKTLNSLQGKKMETAAFSTFIKLISQIKSKKSRTVLKVYPLAGTFFKGGTINIMDLTKELNSILADSHYRLMSSSINGSKSNLLTYEHFYHDAANDKYYGYIYKCKINGLIDGVIYHDLSCKDVDIIDLSAWNAIAKKKIKAVNVPIDLL